MTSTLPGTVTLTLGNQSGVTIVDMDHPEREHTAPPETKPAPPPPPKRKYRRRHLDKSRLDEATEKEMEHDEG